MKLLEYIVRDLSGLYFALADRFALEREKLFSTFWMRAALKLRGVRYGEHIAFYGRACVRRYVMSSITIGNNCRFRSSFRSNLVGLNRHCLIATLRKNAVISIGDKVGLSGTVIGAAERITIGNNVLCGGNTFITDYDWHPIDRLSAEQPISSAPVTIEDDVWIGLNVVVLKGVTIGKGSVIGANSTVVKAIPPGVIAAGSPCKVIRPIRN